MSTDRIFMERALDLAAQALAAGEFPVGCVIAANAEIVATGERTGTGGGSPNEVDHAEMLALRQLARKQLVDKGPLTLYATLEPCLMCFGAILLNGISRIVYAYEDVMGGGTGCDLTSLPALYREHPMSIVAHFERARSLSLFKSYFSDPANAYWRDSLLARYTLAQ